MKKSRFIEEQIVAILREADRTHVSETARKHKISDATFRAPFAQPKPRSALH